jgi:hypothetical protein
MQHNSDQAFNDASGQRRLPDLENLQPFTAGAARLRCQQRANPASALNRWIFATIDWRSKGYR